MRVLTEAASVIVPFGFGAPDFDTRINDVNDFLEIVYNNTNNNCYPADYELYGNFCFKYHRDKIEIKHLNYNFYGRESRISPFWSDNEIINLINTNSDKEVISFHTWGEN